MTAGLGKQINTKFDQLKETGYEVTDDFKIRLVKYARETDQSISEVLTKCIKTRENDEAFPWGER